MPTVDERYQAKLRARANGTTKVTVHERNVEDLPPADRYQAKLAAHAKRLEAGAGQDHESEEDPKPEQKPRGEKRGGEGKPEGKPDPKPEQKPDAK